MNLEHSLEAAKSVRLTRQEESPSETFSFKFCAGEHVIFVDPWKREESYGVVMALPDIRRSIPSEVTRRNDDGIASTSWLHSE